MQLSPRLGLHLQRNQAIGLLAVSVFALGLMGGWVLSDQQYTSQEMVQFSDSEYIHRTKNVHHIQQIVISSMPSNPGNINITIGTFDFDLGIILLDLMLAPGGILDVTSQEEPIKSFETYTSKILTIKLQATVLGAGTNIFTCEIEVFGNNGNPIEILQSIPLEGWMILLLFLSPVFFTYMFISLRQKSKWRTPAWFFHSIRLLSTSVLLLGFVFLFATTFAPKGTQWQYLPLAALGGGFLTSGILGLLTTYLESSDPG